MAKLKIKIHPTFVFFACVLIYFGYAKLFLNYLIVIFLHEFSHAFVARKLGYNIKDIKVIPFGICLNINSFDLMPKDEIKIAIAGPLINFVLALLTTSLWWIFPESYNYTYLFCYANLITCLFNLIPAFPLDGGRVLLGVLRQNFSNKIAVKTLKIFNIVICVILLSMFILSCFIRPNFTFLLVIICLLSGLNNKNESQRYSLVNFANIKKIGKVVKVKDLFVKSEVPLYKVLRHIDNFSYLNIFVGDNDKKIMCNLTEDEFLGLLEKTNATQTFENALKNNLTSNFRVKK